MTNPPMEMLVFKDGEGHYYVLPRQAWEQARVPDERRHEVEQLLAGGAKSVRPLRWASVASPSGRARWRSRSCAST